MVMGVMTTFLFTLSFYGSHAFQTSVKMILPPTTKTISSFKQLQQQQSTLVSTKRRSNVMSLNLMMDPNDALLTHITTVASTTPVATPTQETLDNLMDLLNSQWLADAKAAAAATVATKSNDGGWWSAYLNIFKTALNLVHNTIDGPLRSVGITQTWGPSIALFTAGKL
jgi:hypothetical protein